MDGYRKTVRIRVMAGRGIVDVRALDRKETEDELDRAIVKLAERTLNHSRLLAFFFAYHCEPSWKRIHELYETQLRKTVQLSALKRYGSDALRVLREKARDAPELTHWERQYRARKQEE